MLSPLVRIFGILRRFGEHAIGAAEATSGRERHGFGGFQSSREIHLINDSLESTLPMNWLWIPTNSLSSRFLQLLRTVAVLGGVFEEFKIVVVSN